MRCKAALPASKKAGASTDENKIAQKLLAEMRAGIDGLHAFMDNFAGADILNDEERAMLTASCSQHQGLPKACRPGWSWPGETEKGGL